MARIFPHGEFATSGPMGNLMDVGANVGYATEVAPDVMAVVSRLQDYDGNPIMGNMARGYCDAIPGAEDPGFCKDVCPHRNPNFRFDDTLRTGYDPDVCADDHFRDALGKLGISQRNFVKVTVSPTGGGPIGFVDTVDFSEHPDGHREAKRLNSFYFSEEEVEGAAVFARDGGYIAIAGETRSGLQVAGQILSLRPDMVRGHDNLPTLDGQRQTYIQHSLGSLLRHEFNGEQVDPDSVKIRLVAAVSANYNFSFEPQGPDGSVNPRHSVDHLFPGWHSENPPNNYMYNLTRRDWTPGQPFQDTDVWRPDYPGMTGWLIRDAARNLEIPLSGVELTNPLDPSAEGGRHSSHVNVKRGYKDRETADMYAVVLSQPKIRLRPKGPGPGGF